MLYKHFKVRHPEYDRPLWSKCRAFYAGGETLLRDERVMEECFPPHLSEQSKVYKERSKRAFYIPYAGEIINSICAGLFSEELKVSAAGKMDGYYEEFMDDCSPSGGKEMSFVDLLKKQMLNALLCKRAWTLVDLPEFDGAEEVSNLKEEEELGLDDAYAVPIDPEMVLDWEDNDQGELEWALICNKTQRRGDITEDRGICREEYTLYYPDRWERYVVEYPIGVPPKPEAEIELVGEGPHSFGQVPLLRLELDDGMWAMGKILPIAIAHFNLRNALSWAEYKSLFPVLASFKQGIDAMNPITEDPDRDVNAVLGQGYIMSLAEKDKLQYIGPDSAPFSAAMSDLDNLRDEMHRVLHQMALSVDNSGAALQRSAQSKQVDQQATAIVLKSLSQMVIEHALQIMSTVQAGRVEEKYEWNTEGMDSYDEISLGGLFEMAETLDTIQIPSATFRQIWTYNLARRALGTNATDEELEKIRKELESNITNEMFMMDFESPVPTVDLTGVTKPIDDEEEEEEPPPTSGRMFKSS